LWFINLLIMASTIKDLQKHVPQTGTIQWIGIRPEKRAPLIEKDEVVAVVDQGLDGDHFHNAGGKRQVTLIQAEHLEAVANMMNQETLDPGLTRRNILVSGVNLLAFKDHSFQLGDEVVLEMTGLCHPCSRMEENLGDGGYAAMRGHGGITAKVIRGGKIRKGDTVKLVVND
jgi:MOSC domain-containing protein YiiM